MNRDYAFAMAVKYFGTLKKLARKIGIDPAVLLYQRNHAKQIDLRIALKIEMATDYAVRWYKLTEEKDMDMIRRLEKSALPEQMDTSFPIKKLLSERVFEAMAQEERLGKRQGQRNDLYFVPNNDEVPQNANNVCLFKGRTDVQVARDIGLNRTQYRDAKKVLLKGSFELIKAMDEWLKPYQAVKLTRYSLEKQHWILSLTRQEIMDYIKEKSSAVSKSAIEATSVFHNQ